MTNITQNEMGFKNLGIKDVIVDSLNYLKITSPSLIQKQSIPVALKGSDLIGIAKTGTGKTFAFGLPIIQNIYDKKHEKALILVPTRELAIQLAESLRSVSLRLGIRVSALIGGQNIDKQIFELKKKPNLVVATPGRLMDHLNRSTYKVNDINYLVLDEADMMFDLGFAPQIIEIIKKTPKEKQTMLFSATMPPAITKLASENLKTPIRIEVSPQGSSADNIEQEIYVVNNVDKFFHLKKVLQDYNKSVLIFVRTKRGATELNDKLKALSYNSVEIHSNLSLAKRRYSLDSFKSGKANIMVATDVAARGLDIKEVQLVVNYNMPETSSDYVHRVGRTARAGNSGKAISFATPSQFKEIRSIEQLINKKIKTQEFAKLEKGQSRTYNSRRFRAANKSANFHTKRRKR